jgi:hypothetical protein
MTSRQQLGKIVQIDPHWEWLGCLEDAGDRASVLIAELPG